MPFPSLLVFFLFFYSSNALPVPAYPSSSSASSPLAFVLSLVPFPILAIAKFAYLRYRKGDLIHLQQDEQAVISEKSTTNNFRLGLLKFGGSSNSGTSGYLVGFLGSPDWEVRIKCRVDKVIRKSKRRVLSACPSPIQSGSESRALMISTGTTTGNGTSQSYSTAASSSKRRSHSSRSNPRSASGSCVAFHTPHSQGDITSCSAVHPLSPACCCGPHLPALPPAAHALTHTIHTVRARKDSPPSPTLMQIMEPVLSSWYESDSLSQDRSTSSGANMSSGINSTSLLYSSSIANTSSAFNTSSGANTSSGGHTSSAADLSSGGNTSLGANTSSRTHSSSDNTRHTRSNSPSALISRKPTMKPNPDKPSIIAPPFETPLTSPSPHSGYTTQHLNSVTRRHIVQDVPSTPSNNEITTPTPSSLSISVFDAPVVTIPVTAYSAHVNQQPYDLLHEDWYRKSGGQPMQILLSPTHSSPPVQPNILELVNPDRRPFTRTTRPLNLSPNLQNVASLVGAKASPTVKAWRRHSSGTPPNMPSPLRNAILFDSSSFSASASAPDIVELSTARGTNRTITARGSWELEDLVRDGRLDVDAVSAALGLGLGGVDLGDSSTTSGDSSRSMGWGRARESGTTILHMRPGALLCAIPEETDDIASSRFSSNSGSMLLDVDLDLLNSYGNSSSGNGSGSGNDNNDVSGASRTGSSRLLDDTQDVSVVWEDEESWRDSHSYRYVCTT